MRVRDYRGPLGVLAAGVIGVSLLCSVSAMAMTDLKNYVPATFVPLNIIDLAVGNLNTAVALTEHSVTQFVPTETVTPSPTGTASLTPSPSNTPRRFVTPTTKATRLPRDSSTAAPNNPPRTSTPRPAPTNTDVPPTNTSVPPTNTPLPPPTDTEAPPPTVEPPTVEPPTVEPPTVEPPTVEPPPATNPPVVVPLSTESAPIP